MTPLETYTLDRVKHHGWNLPCSAPDRIFRYDSNGERYYATVERAADTYDVQWYPSVTAVLRGTSPMPYGLLAWYKKHGDEADIMRDEAAERGTAIHALMADYLMGAAVDLSAIPADYVKPLLSFAQFVHDYGVTPLAVEVPVVSTMYGIAGTIDLVCSMTTNRGREVCIVDFKTGSSFYRDHAVQLAYYREAWNAYVIGAYQRDALMTDGAPIVTNVFNVAPKDFRKEPTYAIKSQKDIVTLDELMQRASLFALTAPTKPRPRTSYTGSITRQGYTTPQPKTVTPEQLVITKFEAIL